MFFFSSSVRRWLINNELIHHYLDIAYTCVLIDKRYTARAQHQRQPSCTWHLPRTTKSLDGEPVKQNNCYLVSFPFHPFHHAIHLIVSGIRPSLKFTAQDILTPATAQDRVGNDIFSSWPPGHFVVARYSIKLHRNLNRPFIVLIGNATIVTVYNAAPSTRIGKERRSLQLRSRPYADLVVATQRGSA